MLHVRQLSDVHLEFHYDLFESGHGRAAEMVKELLPPLPTDKKSVLIIGGDLAPIYKAGRIITFLKLVQPRFRHVIYVLGNHEHYHGSLENDEDALLDALHESKAIEMDALTIAGDRCRVAVIKGVRFICGTLWTDYFGNQEAAKAMAQQRLRDHHTIKLSAEQPRLVTPDDLLAIHRSTLKDFGEALCRAPDKQRTVVVTHHMPSRSAIDPMYMLSSQDRVMNGAFASDLDAFILQHQPAYWFFGHTHTPYRGKVGETQLVCNPLGYPQEGNLERGRFNTSEVFSI